MYIHIRIITSLYGYIYLDGHVNMEHYCCTNADHADKQTIVI